MKSASRLNILHAISFQTLSQADFYPDAEIQVPDFIVTIRNTYFLQSIISDLTINLTTARSPAL
jgi:hypothetical protein